MTRTTNARVAGATFLLYIAIAFPATILFDRATSGQGAAAKLAGIAQHAADVRLTAVLSLLSCFAALVLGVTLYRITRDADRDLAMLAMACRVGEGVIIGISVPATLGLLWLATAAGAHAPDAAAAGVLGMLLLEVGARNTIVAATFFAVGSTLFSYLFLRGRVVPVPLAWLGIVASALLVVGLPAQLAGFLAGPAGLFMWLPALVFEVTLAVWLLIKGVAAAPATR
jgi:hypothetical protein